MNKKLYLGNGYLGGVCEGLGEWSEIPSIIWRLAFLFIFPSAFIIYILLWTFIKRKDQG